MFIFTILLLLVSNLDWTVSVTSHILKPIRGGYEAVLFITPTDGVSGQAYKPLASKLQEISPLSLWVVLLDEFTNGEPSSSEVLKSIELSLADLKTEGLQNGSFFIAGHGEGGLAVTKYIQDHFEMFSGCLLYASKIPDNLNLKDYLLPTVSLSGDMDGVLRITKMLNMYLSVEEIESRTVDLSDFRTLFMVLPGVNHSQFASGPMPNYIKQHDIRADLDDEDAHWLIANFTNAFLVATLMEPKEYVDSADELMQISMNYTRKFMKPLFETMSMDRCTSLDVYYCWIRIAQTTLISMSDKYSRTWVSQKEVEKMKLLTENPVIDYFDASLNVGVYTTVLYDKANFPDSPQAARAIQTKLVQQSTAKDVFPSGHYSVVNQTCIALNKEAHKFAISLASNHSLQRMYKRGRQIHFMEDMRYSSEIGWLEADIKLENDANGLTVQSSSYNGNIAKSNVSILACSLLTPFKVLEWIYIDSLK